MSKYGSGTSMRTVIESEVLKVKEILDRNDLHEEDVESILDTVKEFAYQWCTANASACAMEGAIRNLYPDLSMPELVREIMYNGVYQETMNKTYPY